MLWVTSWFIVGASLVAVLAAPAVVAERQRFKMTADIPESVTTPDNVKTSMGELEFFDGVPTKATVDKIYDYVDLARAVEVFINMTPAVSMCHLRQGMRDMGLTKSNQILIAEQFGDSKPLIVTWNNTSLHTWGFLELKNDGPTAIELPGVLGALSALEFAQLVSRQPVLATHA